MDTHWITYDGLELRVEGRAMKYGFISDSIKIEETNLLSMLNKNTISEIERIVFEENYKTD